MDSDRDVVADQGGIEGIQLPFRKKGSVDYGYANDVDYPAPCSPVGRTSI